MQAGLMSGVIFVFNWPAHVVKEISSKFRAVSIMHRYPGVDLDMIGVANQDGVDLLVSRLHDLGHRKIGFLGRSSALHWSTQRFGGYVASLSRVGIPYRPEWVIDMEAQALTTSSLADEAAMAEAVRLIREDGVQAWICSTETVGQRFHGWCISNGLRIPEDVSITGFHRSENDMGELPLTSVTASYQAMGAAALRRLLYRIQNPAETTRQILFPFELYEGTSVAAPRTADGVQAH